MIVIIGFVLERQPCLSEWQVAESFPVTPNDSDQEYALNITPKLYWPDSTTLQYNSIDTLPKQPNSVFEKGLKAGVLAVRELNDRMNVEGLGPSGSDGVLD